jgi:hypothetical protein
MIMSESPGTVCCMQVPAFICVVAGKAAEIAIMLAVRMIATSTSKKHGQLLQSLTKGWQREGE